MRYAMGVLAFLAAMACAAIGGAGGEYIYIKEVTMQLEGENATFELNYSLETFARFYVLALGCRCLEPELISLFGNRSSVKLLAADMDSAALLVRGGPRNDDGYRLFHLRGNETEPLKDAVARFTVIYPEGRALTYYNLTSRKDLFAEASAFLNLSCRS